MSALAEDTMNATNNSSGFSPMPGGAVLHVKNLTCGYTRRPVIRNVSFSLAAGEVVVLLGPNGVGKSTLFKTILGLLPRLGGDVFLCGENTTLWQAKRFAQMVAYVPQTHESVFGYTVREMVLMGRTPALHGLACPKQEDEAIVNEVMNDLGLSALANRNCTTLSGGEQQMVLIARALAQRPQLLIMDEPCAGLDVANQVRVLSRVQQLARTGLAVLITSHDPAHALLLDDKVVCLNRNGKVQVHRARSLDASVLEELYGIEMGMGTIYGAHGKTSTVCVPFLTERLDDCV